MAADGECPARKALEYIERWTDSQECACVSPGPGPEIVCGRCVSLAKARAALSVPCPADQFLAERDLAIKHLSEASRKLGAQDAVIYQLRAERDEALEALRPFGPGRSVISLRGSEWDRAAAVLKKHEARK